MQLNIEHLLQTQPAFTCLPVCSPTVPAMCGVGPDQGQRLVRIYLLIPGYLQADTTRL